MHITRPWPSRSTSSTSAASGGVLDGGGGRRGVMGGGGVGGGDEQGFKGGNADHVARLQVQDIPGKAGDRRGNGRDGGSFPGAQCLSQILSAGGWWQDAVDDDVAATDPDLVQFPIRPFDLVQRRRLGAADQDSAGSSPGP